jgi:hypothetical protein
MDTGSFPISCLGISAVGPLAFLRDYAIYFFHPEVGAATGYELDYRAVWVVSRRARYVFFSPP